MVFKPKKKQEEPTEKTQEQRGLKNSPDRQEIRDIIEGHLNRAVALLKYL